MAKNAHAIFITEEDKRQNNRKALETQALSLWQNYAEEYKTLPIDYFFCLQEKYKRGMKSHKLPFAIEDYPNLPLLRFMRYDDVDKFIRKLTMDELKQTVETTQETVEYNFVIRSLRDWIKDARYLINRYDDERFSSSNK